jgi:hypothetical protein
MSGGLGALNCMKTRTKRNARRIILGGAVIAQAAGAMPAQECDVMSRAWLLF